MNDNAKGISLGALGVFTHIARFFDIAFDRLR